MYLQTVSCFSQFIFGDHNDHRFYFVSANSFIFLSIYLWGPKGPQILYSIYKQFHFSLNLFLGDQKDHRFYFVSANSFILFSIYFWRPRGPQIVFGIYKLFHFSLQTVSFFSQFIFGDHNDHRFYFVSTNSFTFLSIYFRWPQGPQILFCICKQFHSFLNLFLGTTRTTDYVWYLQTLSLFSANSFIFLSIYFWGPQGPRILFCIYKHFHFSLNLFLLNTMTTDSVLYLQTVSFFSQFIYGDQKDHRFCILSTNSFIFLSIYFWGPKGPQILFCICKQFHSFLNLFLRTTGTTDCILYLQTLSLFSQFILGDHNDHRFYFVSTNSFTFLSIYFWWPQGPQILFCICKQFHSFLNLFLGTTRTTDYVLYLQTLSFFSQFIFGDHKDHGFYFVSTNTFIFLSIYFCWPQWPQILFCIYKQFHFSLILFLLITMTTDSVLCLQRASFISQFIFGDHKDHGFCILSSNSFIFPSIYLEEKQRHRIIFCIYKLFHFLSIYFWGTQGPQILYFIYKQLHFSLNLFLMTTRTTDSILYLHTVSLCSQFIFGDHWDHRLYFVSTNSFIFLSIYFCRNPHYTMIPRTIIPGLTKWQLNLTNWQFSDFFFLKKGLIFSLPVTGFTNELFLPLTGARKYLYYPSRGFSTPGGSWFFV